MDAESDVATLIGQLTLEEKASLCLGSDFWHTAGIERLGIPAVMLTDGPHGVRKKPEGSDQMGLSGSVPATCFPTACALASSWNVDLARRIGVALGLEARTENVGVLLGPGLNIKRSPLCGRNFEYFSEDPLLSGALGAALVVGIQSQGVGTSAKHFAANNQETDRMRVSVDVDERTLREIYLPGFEHIIKQAKPWSVMCSYNKINGTYASQDPWLLTTVLRDEWGYDGLVMSDWGAVHDRVAAVAAGLDLEMPPNLGVSDAAIVAAVRNGTLPESVLDVAVGRVLELVRQALPGLSSTDSFDASDHHTLARSAAQECAVLLRNDGDLLPLQLEAGHHLAVIGEFARTPRYQGAGSSQVNPTHLDVALDELRAGMPEGVEVSFAPGFALDDDGSPDPALAEEAVTLATGADTVLLFVGLTAKAESEGFDRPHMDLPPDQVALIERVAAANPRLVVVISGGSTVRLSNWEHSVPVVIEGWLAGQAAGGAISDLLLGTANFSGRLAETIPLRLQDNSAYLNFPGDSGHVRYGEGVFVGYRGYDALDQAVSYPFGHGLSYTTFEYADLTTRLSGRHETGDLRIEVTCQVTNSGERAGQEVVQLYVHDIQSLVARPVRELKAFDKVRLEPGASTTVTFTLTSRDLSFWSESRHDWALEAGGFEIAVGASSRDLRLATTVDIEAPSIAAPLTAGSTLQEWLADPAGHRALHALAGADESGRLAGLLADEEIVAVIGGASLATLAAFPDNGFTPAMVDVLVSQV